MPSNAMTLGQKQRLFTKLLPRLLDYIQEQGYECTLGDGYRDPRAFGAQGVILDTLAGYGRPRSAHKWRLAIDLNLFLDGEWQTTTEAHRPFGEFWERQHVFCQWGGHFDDGNHYSMIHEGVK
jgi:hypothetical protein